MAHETPRHMREITESFINEMAEYNSGRNDYASADLDPAFLLPAITAVEAGMHISPVERQALHTYSERYEEYDGLAAQQFGTIHGFHLRLVDFNLMDLSNHSDTGAVRESGLSHVILRSSLNTSGVDRAGNLLPKNTPQLELKKIGYRGTERHRLLVTEHDRRVTVEAIARLGTIKHALSEL